MKKAIFILAGVASAALSMAQAPLAPGGSSLVPVVALGPGTIIDSRIGLFSGLDFFGNVAFTGRFESIVFQRPSGELSFLYRFSNTGGGLADPINRIATTDFAGFATAVRQDPAFAFGISPTNTISADRSANGRRVGFDFVAVNPGEYSSLLIVDTNARAYRPGQVSILNGGTANIQSFAPVPEPATMLALGAGVAALVRRRKKA